jgi:hypothetical protein
MREPGIGKPNLSFFGNVLSFHFGSVIHIYARVYVCHLHSSYIINPISSRLSHTRPQESRKIYPRYIPKLQYRLCNQRTIPPSINHAHHTSLKISLPLQASKPLLLEICLKLSTPPRVFVFQLPPHLPPPPLHLDQRSSHHSCPRVLPR